MTTIAWDGKTLAADSLVSCNDSRCSFTRKIHSFFLYDVNTEVIVGGAGNLSQVTALVGWLQDRTAEKPVVDKMEAIVISAVDRRIMKVELYDYTLHPFEIDGPFAIGTGWMWAVAAMDHGKAAVNAVEYAVTRDVYTGGVIRTWSGPK
jgi:hypothetical protein